MAARLLRSWVRIPQGAWIFVCCECRMLSGRGLCDELITRPEESYRLWCVVVCDLETSRIGAPYTYDNSSLRVKCIIFLSEWEDTVLQWAFKANSVLATAENPAFKRPHAKSWKMIIFDFRNKIHSKRVNVCSSRTTAALYTVPVCIFFYSYKSLLEKEVKFSHICLTSVTNILN